MLHRQHFAPGGIVPRMLTEKLDGEVDVKMKNFNRFSQDILRREL